MVGIDVPFLNEQFDDALGEPDVIYLECARAK